MIENVGQAEVTQCAQTTHLFWNQNMLYVEHYICIAGLFVISDGVVKGISWLISVT